MNTLQKVLNGKAAFALPTNIMKGIPLELATLRPQGLPHSLYEELWHLHYWLKFSWALIRGEQPTLPAHSSEAFPKDNDSLTETSWQELVNQVLKDLEAVAAIADNELELAHKFRADRTVGEELTVVATHNAYHFGRMVSLRQILGIWSADLGDTW